MMSPDWPDLYESLFSLVLNSGDPDISVMDAQYLMARWCCLAIKC